MTWDRQQFVTAIHESEIWPVAYAEDVLVRLAHHSSAIEGNTLTISDTYSLLLEELVPSGGSSRREVYEVENHREALARVVAAAAKGEPLSERLVLELHGALMDHLMPDRGHYKSSQNYVRGASWEPVPPGRVPEAMRQWVDQVEWQLANLTGPHLAEAIASSHIAFEKIHPLADGNGRTGRAIIAYQTLRTLGFPAIIEVNEKPQYINMLEAEDAAALGRLLTEKVALEIPRFTAFSD